MSRNPANKLTIEEVRRVVFDLSEGTTELVSTEYINCAEDLTFRCRCGELFQRKFYKFRKGRVLCPACAYKQSGLKRRKPKSKRSVARKPKTHKVKKAKTVHERTYSVRPYSAIPKRTLHNRLSKWRTAVREYYGNTCPVTGVVGSTNVVHHLTSLDTIFNETAKEFGIDCVLKSKTEFRSEKVYREIIRAVRKKHDLHAGILISAEVHREFHTEYGYGENTPQQFDEFLEAHYGISLEDAMSKCAM